VLFNEYDDDDDDVKHELLGIVQDFLQTRCFSCCSTITIKSRAYYEFTVESLIMHGSFHVKISRTAVMT